MGNGNVKKKNSRAKLTHCCTFVEIRGGALPLFSKHSGGRYQYVPPQGENQSAKLVEGDQHFRLSAVQHHLLLDW